MKLYMKLSKRTEARIWIGIWVFLTLGLTFEILTFQHLRLWFRLGAIPIVIFGLLWIRYNVKALRAMQE